MMRLIVAVPLLAAGCLAQIKAPVVSTLTPPKGADFEACVLTDINRDGQNDLVVAAVTHMEPRSRVLHVHVRAKGHAAFASTPDRVVRLTPDVTAFALVDLGAAYGKDVVLLNRSGVWLRQHVDGRRPTAKKLLDAEFIWQMPDLSDVLHWGAGVRDLDGDGLDDLVIPESGAWRVAFQRRDAGGVASFGRVQTLRVPRSALDAEDGPRGAVALRNRNRRKNLELRVRAGSVGAASGPLLQVTESVPAPQLIDWDADGDLDLVARTTSELHVWVQGADGFGEAPNASYAIPVVTDRERRLDISYSAHVADLNADRKADCLFIAGNRRAKDIRTQVLLYLQGHKGRGSAATTPDSPLFGARGIPAQMIQLAGFVGFPRLEDINDDGRPDLSLTTFRPDLIDAMRSQTAKSLDIGWSVFINRGGGFNRRSDLQSSLRLRAKDLDDAKELVLTRFFPDMTGDGIAEVLVQDAPRRLRMIALRRVRGGGVARSEDPVWEHTWNHDAKIILPRRGKDWQPELVIRGHQRLVHLRFER